MDTKNGHHLGQTTTTTVSEVKEVDELRAESEKQTDDGHLVRHTDMSADVDDDDDGPASSQADDD